MSASDGKSGPVSGVGRTPFMGPINMSCMNILIYLNQIGCMVIYISYNVMYGHNLLMFYHGQLTTEKCYCFYHIVRVLEHIKEKYPSSLLSPLLWKSLPCMVYQQSWPPPSPPACGRASLVGLVSNHGSYGVSCNFS